MQTYYRLVLIIQNENLLGCILFPLIIPNQFFSYHEFNIDLILNNYGFEFLIDSEGLTASPPKKRTGYNKPGGGNSPKKPRETATTEVRPSNEKEHSRRTVEEDLLCKTVNEMTAEDVAELGLLAGSLSFEDPSSLSEEKSTSLRIVF